MKEAWVLIESWRLRELTWQLGIPATDPGDSPLEKGIIYFDNIIGNKLKSG